MSEVCAHLNQVPIKVLGDEKPHWSWQQVNQYYYWIGFCPDCKKESLNRYSSEILRELKFRA